jgi:hypothetical protein
VFGSGNVSVISPSGAICGSYGKTGASCITDGTVKFEGGVLTLTTSNAHVNTSGVTYYYQVL